MPNIKAPGRHSYTFYTPEMGRELNHRVALEQQLRHAIATSAFDLAYQPKVDIVSGEVTGIEALLRWHDPDLGWISPANFIPLAEETRLILPLGTWVLTTVCAQMKKWLDQGSCRVPVAVNVSMIQFFESDFLHTLERILSDTGLDPKFLEIELTESILAQNPVLLSAIVGRLRELGIAVSIDDFGTGYSSLSYLKDFQVDKLKIDQSFTQRIHQSEEDNAIVQTAISIARTLKLVTIAEGVETLEQLKFLQEHGCDRAQGYLFSRPVSAFEIEQIFSDERRGILTPQPLSDETRHPRVT
jgi:EAL domain-containing protein (putative c-di-GMP-specific phosphodiesterase class I)